MFDNIINFFKKNTKKKENASVNSKETAKERLHLVLMQDRANVSVDFLDLMRQEIIEVIKKYIDIDESSMDVRLTNQANEDGTQGAPALYANIPIVNIKDEARKANKEKNVDKEKSVDKEEKKNLTKTEEDFDKFQKEEEIKKEEARKIEEAKKIVKEECEEIEKKVKEDKKKENIDKDTKSDMENNNSDENQEDNKEHGKNSIDTKKKSNKKESENE